MRDEIDDDADEVCAAMEPTTPRRVRSRNGRGCIGSCIATFDVRSSPRVCYPTAVPSPRAAIVGIGQTEFAKQLPMTETEVACRAIMAALDDAGLAPRDVDGLCLYDIESTTIADVVVTLGLRDVGFFRRTATVAARTARSSRARRPPSRRGTRRPCSPSAPGTAAGARAPAPA